MEKTNEFENFNALKVVDMKNELEKALVEEGIEDDGAKQGFGDGALNVNNVETPEVKQEKIAAVKATLELGSEQSTVSGQEAVVGQKEKQADVFFDKLVEQRKGEGQFGVLRSNYQKLKEIIQKLPENFEEKTHVSFSIEKLKTVKYDPRRYEFEAVRDYLKNGSINTDIDHSVFGLPISDDVFESSDRVQLLKELGYEGDYVSIASKYFSEQKRSFYEKKKDPLKSKYDIVIKGIKSTNPDNPEFDLRIINRGQDVFPHIYLIPSISEDGSDLMTELLTKQKQ